jgi:hypothetical protein
MKRRLLCSAAAAVLVSSLRLLASAPNGAIFTTLPDGSRVNYNIYASKPDVYLDGGPGDQAPITAAGLPDGRYVFQVTDPPGKVLLSVDPAKCREFDVAGGVIVNAVPAGGCEHATGIDLDHGLDGAKTIQLCGGGKDDPLNPTACFLDTPNPGGEYKVWVTMEEDFLNACTLLGKTNGLDLVDCGFKARSNAHGFLPRHTKTDNFKVRGDPREIDTRFHGLDGSLLDGMGVVWIDTNGASNNKYSYEDLSLDVHHEAHVEDVENGTHQIIVYNQPGCMVGAIYNNGKKLGKAGPQTVSVNVGSSFTSGTIFIDVYCK